MGGGRGEVREMSDYIPEDVEFDCGKPAQQQTLF